MKTQKAQLKYLMIAPRKVRLIANTIKGMSIAEAQAQLLLRPHRAAEALLKLLNSALANARQNQQLSAEVLKVGNVRVDSAPVLKRSLPRAQGRATSIFKRMSHVTIELVELAAAQKPRFVIAAVEKSTKGGSAAGGKAKKPKKPPTRTATKEEQAADLEHSRPEKKSADTKEFAKDNQQSKQGSHGFVKRFFNRKSV